MPEAPLFDVPGALGGHCTGKKRIDEGIELAIELVCLLHGMISNHDVCRGKKRSTSAGHERGGEKMSLGGCLRAGSRRMFERLAELG
jgi:hypothetical protein